MAMLQIHGLYKSFGDKEVLRGVDLAVPEHSIFGFLGKNGAGKTTAMKAVLGLLPADSGSITVAGLPVRYGRSETNRYVGYLPDVPEFYTFMTAPEYLRFCGRMSGMLRAELDERIRSLLGLVGLAGEGHRIKGFSRGMKQRLGIAAALLGRPRLLICDEPTSALDPVGRREILELLLAVAQETTVLFSTHILSDAERICTDIAVLNDGVIGIHGKLSELKTRYRREEYRIEPEREEDALRLKAAFPELADGGSRALSFREGAHTVFDVMQWAAERRIPLLRLEREEPTLESLFMEVTEK